jgi:hypothetical protein
MTDWMQYVWMQYPRPTATTGVDVTLTVIDPNGNHYAVASATSDANGFYSTSFTPEVPGRYTLIATFDGTKSYYGSTAVTAIEVEDAPEPTAAPTLAPASAVETYFVPAVIAIIIAIVLVGVVIIMVLKKRP